MASAPPPAYEEHYYPPNFDAEKRRQFDATVNRLDIQDFYLSELHTALSGTKKVVIVDNSGSMGSVLQSTHLNKADFGGRVRRVDELVTFLKTAVPLLALDSPSGIDFWFLNNADGTPGPLLVPGVHTYDQIVARLTQEPNGRTPLVTTLRQVQQHYQDTIHEQGLHCIITTDGAPTEGDRALYDLVYNRQNAKRFIINFLVCTDDDSEVEYLDILDRKAEAVDVTDDFATERAQVLKTKKVSKFSYDDYICKAIIGAASPRIDQMDEEEQQSGCWLM